MADDQIRAFCIDFNWDWTRRFASPGLYAQADPARHLEWYRELGVNTIQSFCVSHNGYAWYDSDIAPRTPGMEGPFFTKLAEMANKKDFRVMGYFSPGANEHWRWAHPDLSHDKTCPTSWHMPYSDRYNDYLAAIVEEFMARNPMQGFMVDFMWGVEPTGWLPVEREIYEQVMEEAFPTASLPDAEATKQYQIRQVRRAWTRLRETAKAIDPETIIWLVCSNTSHYQAQDTGVTREADWLMNEHPSLEALETGRRIKGDHTTLIQCVCGWDNAMDQTIKQHDAAQIFAALAREDAGIYGFAQPHPVTTLPDVSGDNANARNIRSMKANFR